MNERGEGATVLLVVMAAVLMVLLTGVAMWGYPTYNVWQQQLAGEAELKRATFNRQIAVQEANAKKESARALADAEVLRAEGAAKANVILGNSLKGNDDYLRYLWINNLEHGGTAPTVIYVPTEAGLPILEAGRRP